MNSLANWLDLVISFTIVNQKSDFCFIKKNMLPVVAKFRKSRRLQNVAATFLKNSATREEIGKAGAEMFNKR